MKNKKNRIISLTLAFVMALSAMCVQASAVSAAPLTLLDDYQLDPNYAPEYFGGTISAEEVFARRLARSLNGEDGSGVMPYNPGSGDTGAVIFSFTAEADTIYWTIDWDDAGIDDTYYYQLWRVNGNGIPNSKVGSERQCSFGAGQYYSGLIIDAVYYIQCSSMCVPARGAEVTYSYSF